MSCRSLIRARFGAVPLPEAQETEAQIQNYVRGPFRTSEHPEGDHYC